MPRLFVIVGLTQDTASAGQNMNIYKKTKLRNLTNEELNKLLNETNWYDNDLLREHEERIKDGRIKLEKNNFKPVPETSFS